MIGAQQRWRELRAQGAQIDAAARAAPGRRHLEASVRGNKRGQEAPGVGLVLSPSYSITTAGLKKVLEGKADVCIGGESSAGSPSCVVLYTGRLEEDCLEGMGRIRELYPGVPLLVLGSHLDLGLAWATLKNGADGFVHAQMDPAQVAQRSGSRPEGRACRPQAAARVPPEPEREPQDWGALGPWTRDLGDGRGGLEQRPDSGRLYLSESTIKQHLGAAYKVLGVCNRTEAAKTMREHARGD